MELPPFHHHHRYVPLPPRPPNFADDHSNFYPHHQLHPPAPPLPPPHLPLQPPPSHRPFPAPPPPPTLNARQSQFTFLNTHHPPLDDDPRRPHLFDNTHHPSPPSCVSIRTLFEDDHPRLRLPDFDNSFADPWADLPRVPPDLRPTRPVHLSFDHEPRHPHHPFNDHHPVSPYRPVNNYEHDLERSFRFRDEFVDGFREIQNRELLWVPKDSHGGSVDDEDYYRHDRNVYVSNGSRNFTFGVDSHCVSDPNPPRDFVSNVGNYDSCYGSASDSEKFWNDRNADRRWGYSGQPSRNVPDPPIVMENNEFGRSDRVPVVSARKVLHVDDSGKFNDRGRECSQGTQEFTRTPRKQIQRKSALLRIQLGKPSNRNRSLDQHFSKAYFDDSNDSTFRGKDPLVYPGPRIEEEREGSPVELDVSFKSNALIAKAIVTSSSPPVVSDRDLMPRNGKTRKFAISDSPVTKFSGVSVKSDSSRYGSDFPSSSDKVPKQLTVKAAVSVNGSVGDIGAQSCSSEAYDSAGNCVVKGSPKGRVSDRRDGSVGSNVASLHRVRKKKRITSPLSRVSSLQPTNKGGEPGNCHLAASQPAEGVMNSKEKITSADMVLAHNVVFLSTPNEVGVSPQTMVSDKNSTDFDPASQGLPNTKSKRNSLTSLLGSSCCLEMKVVETTGNADTLGHGLHFVSNSDEGLTEFRNGSIVSDSDRVEDVGTQHYQNGVPLLLDNGLVKESSEVMASVGGDENAGLPSPKEIKFHKGVMDTYASVHVACDSPCSDYGLVKRQENVAVSDLGSEDSGSKQSSLNRVTISLGNSIADGSLCAGPTIGGSGILGVSSAEEMKTSEHVVVADVSNHDSSTTSSSNSCLVDDSNKQSCLSAATTFLENGAIEGSLSSNILVENNLNASSGKGYTPKLKRKRKDRTIQLGLSSSRTSNIPPNSVSSTHDVDTTLSCPVKDFVYAEEEVTISVAGDVIVGSQSCQQDDIILHGNSLNEGSSEVDLSFRGGVNVDPNVSSPIYRKKTKFSAPALSFSVPFEIHEGPLSADTSGTSIEMPSNIDKGTTQLEEEVVISGIDTVCSASLPPCSKPVTVLLDNSVAGASFESNLAKDGSRGECSKIEKECPCPSRWGTEQKEDATLVKDPTKHKRGTDIESGSRGEIVATDHAAQEHDMHCTKTALFGRFPLEMPTPNLDQRLSNADIECDGCLLAKDDFPSVSNNLSVCADVDGISATNSSDESMDSVPYTPSSIGSPENLAIVSGSYMSNTKSSISHVSNQPVLNGKPTSESGPMLFSVNTTLDNSSINMKSTSALAIDLTINTKTASFSSQDTNKTTKSLNPMRRESNLRNRPSSAVPRVFPGHSSLVFPTSRKTVPSSQIAKARTWHRTSNPSAPLPGKKSYSNPVLSQRQSPKKVGKIQPASYIRKGNSLVRKPGTVAAPPQSSHALSSSGYRLNPSGIHETKKCTGSETRVDVIDPLSCSGTGGLNAPLERPKTPPLHRSTKLPNSTAIYLGELTPSSLANPPTNASSSKAYPLELTKNMDVPKPSEDAPKSSGTPEYPIVPTNKIESQSVPDEGNSGKKISYVKRKSNQLVAASNSNDLSVQDLDKSQVLSSDGYYKRRRNQLIRTSFESHVMQKAVISNDNANSEGQRAPKVIPSMSSSKRLSGKGFAKSYKPSKFSLVWTLCDTQSSRKECNLLQHQVWPQLFPWKRATYLRSFVHNSASIANNSPFSTISQKLLLSRKRNTVYRRSTNGFSLRISKVLGVGGSSLKWSKSIERNSKKANEEATLAVAAVEKKKREQTGAVHAVPKSKNPSRKRIFRIGSVRYKMDPTRRTLQRISDEEPTCSTSLRTEEDAKKCYVPRRLLIGNDEYVRIGNGNQLIRDPKKRTRVLASEKVRWSLHTARLRLARKRKYCQFFTRFGKCNKEDGKCPYIHDPSKVAVCTKFLNGSCSNPDCKLTHKIIPERMQDCSYFLQGLCSNKNCPYRHVNVNPNASICEGFLKGYCADGNECRKKHTYVCPVFEATGICNQGSKCKLHHPKKRSKGTKRKPSREQKNAQGRYFGSRHVDITECRTALSEKHFPKADDDIFCQEGKFTEFINLDVGDGEDGETNDPSNKKKTMSDSDSSDLLVADFDELTKPIRIMNKNLMTESSSAFGSPNQNTASYVSEESNLL